jgi:hypothetical protein
MRNQPLKSDVYLSLYPAPEIFYFRFFAQPPKLGILKGEVSLYC